MFPRGVGGEITLEPPAVWETDLRGAAFKLAEGEEFEYSFTVVLGQNAYSGEQKVRVDFDITADRRYSFSVYRRLDVGLGDMGVEVTTHMEKNGNLVESHQLVNRTDDFLDSDCLLFVPNRRRQRLQVLKMGRGRNTQTHVLPDGQGLVVQTIRLRVEQIGGERVLNHSFTVQP